jgi:hypothetical protein
MDLTNYSPSDMMDYYKNLTIKDVNAVLDLNASFAVWDSYYNEISCDLYFIGIKNGTDIPVVKFGEYHDRGVTRISNV